MGHIQEQGKRWGRYVLYQDDISEENFSQYHAAPEEISEGGQVLEYDQCGAGVDLGKGEGVD
jgi:hypothetical protein